MTFCVRLMGVVSDENGLITAAFLRGRDANNVFYDSEDTPIDSVQAPMDGSDFTLAINRDIGMFTCEKVKGKTTCTDVGSVTVGSLVYANLDP